MVLSFDHSFIYPFNKYLLNAYSVRVSVLGAENRVVNKPDKVLTFMKPTSCEEDRNKLVATR